jgi:hypothetical protein
MVDIQECPLVTLKMAMKGIRSTFPLILLLLTLSCCKRPPTYESRFKHVITIHYPEGHSVVGFEEKKQRIDKDLRATGYGFVSGVLGGKESIDFVDIDTDFDLVDEKALIERFVENGWIPAEARIEYKRNPYGAPP